MADDDEATSKQPSMEEHRATVVTLALANVHQHGWTEDAIVSAVQAANLPLTLSGVILSETNQNDHGAALVYAFMDRSNAQLRQILLDSSIQTDTSQATNGKNSESQALKERLHFALRTRLEMMSPYLRSKRWHEAMAIGALPQNAYDTTRRLNDLMDCVVQDLNFVAGNSNVHNSMFSRAAIGGVYVACELHMLGDEANLDHTWAFLKERIEELDALANVTTVDATSMLAVSTVAASMGSAVLSLGQPMARGAVSAVAGTILPQLMKMGQPAQRSSSTYRSNSTVPKYGRPSDYEPGSSGGSARALSTANSDDPAQVVKALVDNAIESSDVSYLPIV